MNVQPIEKRSIDPLLQVHSIFETIQGEGPFCGTPCVFIRLAGCNLQCPACDTEYTANRQRMTPGQILDEVRGKRRGGLIVITGGEPFRQRVQLEALFGELCDAGYFIQIESNGTLEPTLELYETDINRRKGVYLVISPKTGKLHPDAAIQACALKYVVAYGNVREEDGLPLTALEHPSNPYPARPPQGWNRPIYVQPLDSKNVIDNDLHTATAVDSCMKFGYTLQLQIHKFIGVE